jgi:hypothetical protein
VTPPALPPGSAPPAPTYQYQPIAPPTYGGQTLPQAITPQAGTYAPSQAQATPQPQPTQPPALAPAPSLKPIPELPRNGEAGGAATGKATGGGQAGGESSGSRGFGGGNGVQPAAPAGNGPTGMPVMPGTGPGAATGAFPRLLEPTSHTTSWGPSDGAAARVQYPTAALPAWRQGQR